MNIANTKSLKMKVLIVALLLSGGSIFGSALGKDAAEAYATSISDVFALESQGAIEAEIVPALSQINPDHAKDTVKKTKLAIRQYKGQINGSFVAGMIVAIDAANTQAHDVESALASAAPAPLDAPAANDNIGSIPPEDTASALPGASADNSGISQAPTDDAAAANASMPSAPAGGPSVPMSIDPNALSALHNASMPFAPAGGPSVPMSVDPNALSALPPIDPNAAHHTSATATHPAPNAEHHTSTAATHPATNAEHHTSTAATHPATNAAHHTSAAATHPAPNAEHHTSTAATHPATNAAHHTPAAATHPAPNAAHHTPTAATHPAPNAAHHTPTAATHRSPKGARRVPAPIDNNASISHP